MSSALATKYFPKVLIDRMLYLGGRQLFDVKTIEDNKDGLGSYTLSPKPWLPSWVGDIVTVPNDWWNIQALTNWLAHGPKVAKPTAEMCEAMKQIEVKIGLDDLALPFPEIMVELFGVPPYVSCLIGKQINGMLSLTLTSNDYRHDITSLIAGEKGDWTVEVALNRFDPSCWQDNTEVAVQAMRIALNSCLLLTDKTKWADWHLAQSDQRLAKERTERGERARKRLSLHVLIAQFDQEIEWRRDCEKHHWEAGEPTGRVMPPHWRKGHWRMQPYGPKNELRKRILVPPTRVNWHLFTGQEKETGVKYV